VQTARTQRLLACSHCCCPAPEGELRGTTHLVRDAAMEGDLVAEEGELRAAEGDLEAVKGDLMTAASMPSSSLPHSI
jgi:hypothetical protein